MEKAAIWEQSLGFVYPDNNTFEKDFLKHSMAKLNALKADSVIYNI
jgi:hypothetical protein